MHYLSVIYRAPTPFYCQILRLNIGSEWVQTRNIWVRNSGTHPNVNQTPRTFSSCNNTYTTYLIIVLVSCLDICFGVSPTVCISFVSKFYKSSEMGIVDW